MPESDCALGRIDPLQLAWAAGFFDGEGSTFVSHRADRPGYLRFDVTVPQCGHERLPEVLLRFQAAVVGLGTITGPDDNDMYFWRANGFQECQSTVALLWPYLGTVKRAQASAAMRALSSQYRSGAFRPRPPRKRRVVHRVHDSTMLIDATPQEIELAWAAGFLDAEGHFGLPRNISRKDGTSWRRMRASASQHGELTRPAPVLGRLQQILGGRIERHGEPDDFRWVVERAPLVVEIYELIRPMLGTVKQEQARNAIEVFRSQTRLHGDPSRCARGHEYDRVYMSASGPKQRCNACARILQRQQRARRGIKPRPFRNAARRYNF